MTDKNVGKTIGIYKILSLCDKKHKDGHKFYHVQCVFCGWEADMRSSDTKRAKKCTHINVNGNYIIFNSYVWDNKRIASIFYGMKNRCYNKKSKDYKKYGCKGIKICNEWLNNPKLFEEWSMNNGYSDELTIDRIDSNKDYCPENCRWVSLEDNAKYKSTTSLINVDGEIHTGIDWSKMLGFSPNVINRYVAKYGLNNTIEFIRKYKANPNLKPKRNQSYYDLYMQ